MKGVITVVLLTIGLVFIGSFSSCHYVSQGEKAFFYDVTSGRPVSAHDNPILPMGWQGAWGINKRFFCVQGTIMDYEFTTQAKNSDKYDETLDWNSSEGVVMAADYKLWGRVSDPWEFFLHFGEPEYGYKPVANKDVKVYEALRQSGRVLEEYLNALASSSDAEMIRTRPDWLKQELLPKVQKYMAQFGFEVTDLMFMGNFRYPDGNVITEARQQLTSLDSEIRGAMQSCSNKANQVRIDVQQETIEANKRISEAQRQASTVLAESAALAEAIKQSVTQIGIDGTIRIKMGELSSQLTKAGTVPVIMLTEDSLMAAPYYRATSVSGDTTKTNAVLPIAAVR